MASTDKQTIALFALAMLAAGCSADDYSRRAERAAQRVLTDRDQAVLGNREATTAFPAQRPPPEPEPEKEAEEPAPGAQPEQELAAQVIDLHQALAIAYETSRQMIDRREQLHLEAVSLTGVRHEYTPQLALTLSYLFNQFEDLPESESSTVRFTAEQILPTGGVLSFDGSTGRDAGEDLGAAYDSLLSLSLAQPLLRGGGYAVTHEPLIQAERNLVYAIRDFELFREDFSIDVARRFYDLVNRKQSIENQVRNLENNEFGRRQAEAFFAVGRTSELDVLRARRSELTARNSLLEAQEDLHLALDQFRIFLGLPPDHPIDVRADAPAFTPVDYDMVSAVEVAFENRLDLQNRREQLEDVERNVYLARNGLLPDLDLTLGASYGTAASDSFGGSDGVTDASVGVTLGVPIDRVRERNAYHAAEISLSRARRDLEEFEDQLDVQIQSSFRELVRRLQSLDIQRQLIEDQTKNLRIAELRFERGELPNRDVVEANQSLLDAQNALIDEQVNYEIERLQLLRDLGILFIGEDGMWK